MVTKIVNPTDKDIEFYTANINTFLTCKAMPPVKRVVKANSTLYSRSVTGDTNTENYLTQKGCTLSQVRRNWILVIAGQSNAVGYDESPWEAEDIKPIPYCYFDGLKNHGGYSRADQVPIYNPGVDCFQNMQDVGGVGTRPKGLHYYIAKELIGFVPDDYELFICGYAMGWSGLCSGDAGTVNGQNMPENSTKWNSDGALSIATGKRLGIHLKNIQPESKLLGFIWCQGERDGATSTTILDYKAAFENTINTIESNLTSQISNYSDKLVYPQFTISQSVAYNQSLPADDEAAFVSFTGGDTYVVTSDPQAITSEFRTNLTSDQVTLKWWGTATDDTESKYNTPFSQFNGNIGYNNWTDTGLSVNDIESITNIGDKFIVKEENGTYWLKSNNAGQMQVIFKSKATDTLKSAEWRVTLTAVGGTTKYPPTYQFHPLTENLSAMKGVETTFKLRCTSGYQGRIRVDKDASSVAGSVSIAGTGDDSGSGGSGYAVIKFTGTQAGIFLLRAWFEGNNNSHTAYMPITIKAPVSEGGDAIFSDPMDGYYYLDLANYRYGMIKQPEDGKTLLYCQIINKLNGKEIGYIPASCDASTAIASHSIEYAEANCKGVFGYPLWFVYPGPQKYWDTQGTYSYIKQWQKENFTGYVDLPTDLPTNDCSPTGTKKKAWNYWDGYGYTSSTKPSHYGQNAFRYIAKKIMQKFTQCYKLYKYDSTIKK